jgi:hypothetical protein
VRIQVAVPDEHVTPEVINPVLEAVTRLDEHMLRTGQTPTSHELIRGGAVWRPENPGDEHFDHGGTIAQRGWGDCDDWAPLHAATLRATGEDPGATAFITESGPNTFHALVRRSSGAIDDPSVSAGMRPTKVVGSDGSPQLWLCDPHDGRIYQGALAPTVGPLSIHCGAQMRVRGCTVVGQGRLYQGRVDLPICGSRLVGVRTHKRRGHKRVRGASLPYALSITHLAGTSHEALCGALSGAVMMADACELTGTLDRYKLLAVQSAMAGMGSQDLRNGLYMHLQADMSARPDCLAPMLAELGAPVLGDFLSDCWTLAQSIVMAVGGAISGDFLSDAFDTVSSPIKAVYNAIPSPVKAVLAPASLVTEYAYQHPESIPLFGNLAAQAKKAYEGMTRKGAPVAQAVAAAAAAIHPMAVPTTHAAPAQVLAQKVVPIRSGPRPPAPAPWQPPAAPAPWQPPASYAPAPAPSYDAPPPSYAPPSYAPPSYAPDPGAYAQPAGYDYGGDDDAGQDDASVQGLAPAGRKPPGAAHAATAVHAAVAPHPTAASAPAVTPPARRPGMPAGTTHWHCAPLPGGQWACSWQ